MQSYKDLIVWQTSVDLSVQIYGITEVFPKSELYGLTNQMRRCAISIPSNIAEGQRWGHRNEYAQFLRIAYGSGAELETQPLIAQRIGYLSAEEYASTSAMLDGIMKMLARLMASLL